MRLLDFLLGFLLDFHLGFLLDFHLGFLLDDFLLDDFLLDFLLDFLRLLIEVPALPAFMLMAFTFGHLERTIRSDEPSRVKHGKPCTSQVAKDCSPYRSAIKTWCDP